MPDFPLNLMVSSSVRGRTYLLDQVFAVLTGYGFEVWMSHKGTFPVNPKLTALDNCLSAVDSCDLFLGIITGRYGSGREGNELAITHREVQRAVARAKFRYFAVEQDVLTAREVLKQFRHTPKGNKRPHKFFKSNGVLDDIRVIDMYEDAIRSDLPLKQRVGNWVQPFRDEADLLLFLKSQFSNPSRVRELLLESEANDA
jgi:hypothetical protein